MSDPRGTPEFPIRYPDGTATDMSHFDPVGSEDQYDMEWRHANDIHLSEKISRSCFGLTSGDTASFTVQYETLNMTKVNRLCMTSVNQPCGWMEAELRGCWRLHVGVDISEQPCENSASVDDNPEPSEEG